MDLYLGGVNNSFRVKKKPSPRYWILSGGKMIADNSESDERCDEHSLVGNRRPNRRSFATREGYAASRKPKNLYT